MGSFPCKFVLWLAPPTLSVLLWTTFCIKIHNLIIGQFSIVWLYHNFLNAYCLMLILLLFLFLFLPLFLSLSFINNAVIVCKLFHISVIIFLIITVGNNSKKSNYWVNRQRHLIPTVKTRKMHSSFSELYWRRVVFFFFIYADIMYCHLKKTNTWLSSVKKVIAISVVIYIIFRRWC